MKLSTTFSHRHLNYLECDVFQSLDQAFQMDFQYLRLGVYWDEVEKKEGEYDWSTISSLLEKCEKEEQATVLTIGCKAPRYPEFYFPDWLKYKQLPTLKLKKNCLLLLHKQF